MTEDPDNTGAASTAAASGGEVPTAVARLLKLQGGPRDGALLRHALGLEWLKTGETANAAAAFRQATELDPRFSAAWKLLGKALFELGTADDMKSALAAWQQGIAVAEARGDLQAAKEMRVFARRVDKQLSQE